MGRPGAEEPGVATVRAPLQLRLPAGLFLVAQVLDVWTTSAALAAGGRELNPLSAHVLALGGFLGLTAVKLVVCGAAIACSAVLVRQGRGNRARLALSGICCYYALVVVWNAWSLHRFAAAA